MSYDALSSPIHKNSAVKCNAVFLFIIYFIEFSVFLYILFE